MAEDTRSEHANVTRGSGNVFADLGLPNPEERRLKAQLAMHIRDLIEAQGLTQAQAGERVGLAQPNISNIVTGRLGGYSVERLLQVVNKLGHRVELRIDRQVRPDEEARTFVSAV